MAFRLKANEPVEDGIKRIVLEQVGRAVAEIGDERLARDDAVHRVRKRCKKIRAVARLVRPVFGSHYAFENAFFRDAADELAGLRDAQILLKTYDTVTGAGGKEIDRRHFAPLRWKLVQHCKKVAQDTAAQDERLRKVRSRFREARERIAGWKLKADGFDAVEEGLLETYARGRKAMQLAYQKLDETTFHEWRKRVMYHRYHVRLLRNLWQPLLQPLRHELEALSDLLGDDHDLAVLRAALSGKPDVFGNVKDLGPLLGLIDRRSAELRANIRPLGERVYAEKPKQLGRRFHTYWEVQPL
jgi:CHAD domain-containing protein